MYALGIAINEGKKKAWWLKLEIKRRKSFGETEILHGVSFVAESGEAHGFLGRNGAGKTTTIRCIMDVFQADSGEILLDGKPFNRADHRIGYMPEERGMYEKVPVIDQLVYFGELKGMERSAAKASAMHYLERLNLQDRASDKLEKLSKGNQQKIQIIQSLIDDPEILILDEPFSGLDPVNARTLKDFILEHLAKDRIVLFSSHQMTVVEEFCDDITLIREGDVLLSGHLDDIKEEWGKQQIRISLAGRSTEETAERLSDIPKVDVWQDRQSIIVKLENGMDERQLLEAILDLDEVPRAFEPYRPSLEDIFIAIDRRAEAKVKAPMKA